jgi:hypothetical protein
MASKTDQNVVPIRERLEAMDKEIRSWARLTRKDLLFRLASLNLEERLRLEGEKPLKKSVRSIVRKKQGDIDSVAFGFIRHGIFLEHGVGRGRPVNSPQAIAAAKPWLDVVLPKATQELANIIEEKYADLIESELRLLVPGVIDVTLNPIPEFITYNDGEKDIKIVIDKSFF